MQYSRPTEVDRWSTCVVRGGKKVNTQVYTYLWTSAKLSVIEKTYVYSISWFSKIAPLVGEIRHH